jgi:hypothetical protein
LKIHAVLILNATICLAVAILFSFCFMPVGLAVSSGEVGEALRLAQADFDSAFVAVVEAESSGANVTALLSRLKDADGLLSEAFASYRSEDYEGAASSAASCSRTLEGVADEAAIMKLSAERGHSDKVLLTAVTSGIGLIILFVLGFLGWGLLKRSYSKRVLELKSVVEESQ